jgi:glutaredoxin 3
MTELTLYTKFLCGYCHRAKRLLESKGLTFTEHDITFDRNLRNEMVSRAQGNTTVPQIFIGETHIGGCNELMDLEQTGQLDAMLVTASEKPA